MSLITPNELRQARIRNPDTEFRILPEKEVCAFPYRAEDEGRRCAALVRNSELVRNSADSNPWNDHQPYQPAPSIYAWKAPPLGSKDGMDFVGLEWKSTKKV